MKAVIYTRKSTESKERQVASLTDQSKAAHEVLAKYNLELVAPEFSEAKTGRKAGVRTAFYKMLDLLKAGKADTIICWDASRLARNAKDGGEIIYLVDNANLKILTPYTQYDTSNSFMLFVEFGNSTDFSKKLSYNVKRGLESRVANGLYPGPAPIGYKNLRNEQGRSVAIVPDPVRFPLVRKWWDMVLSGKHSVEGSLREMTALGLTDRYNKPFSKTCSYRLFRNEFYRGEFRFRGELHPGKHEPMVTPEEFEKVQVILNGKRKIQTVTPLPFMNLIKCKCGATITAEKHTKNYKNGTTQTFYYYRATRHISGCTQKAYISPINLEDQVKKYIASLELHPRFVDWVRGVLKRRGAEEFEFDRKTKELQTRKLIAINERKETIWNMKVDGLIDQLDYERRKKDLLVEEKTIKATMNSNRLDYWDRVTDQALDFAASMQKLFATNDLTIKKMVLKILGSNLTLDNGKLLITAKYAFAFLKTTQNSAFGGNGLIEPKISEAELRLSSSTQVPIGEGIGSQIEPSTDELYPQIRSYFNSSNPEAVLLASQLDQLSSYLQAYNPIV